MSICRVVGNEIRISIGKRVLKSAATHHPEFWDPEADVNTLKVSDIAEFQKEVVRYINAEREDGSTLLTDMLDKAILEAVESGCEGIDHDYVPKHRKGCDCSKCDPELPEPVTAVSASGKQP